MASAAKRSRGATYSTEEVLELLEQEENSNDGMSSGEESDLDRQLQSSDDELGQ